MGLRRTELGLKTGRPIRDAEVAGSNPVASTQKDGHREVSVFCVDITELGHEMSVR